MSTTVSSLVFNDETKNEVVDLILSFIKQHGDKIKLTIAGDEKIYRPVQYGFFADNYYGISEMFLGATKERKNIVFQFFTDKMRQPLCDNEAIFVCEDSVVEFINDKTFTITRLPKEVLSEKVVTTVFVD